jgi:integrase/recombinase XerC
VIRYAINRTKYLNKTEQEELLNILKRLAISGSEQERRDTTLLLLLLFTGARAMETLNTTGADLSSDDQSIFIKGMKGSNDREIPLPTWLYRLVKAQVTGSGRIFPISYTRLRQIWDMYRPVPKKLHSLRHSFAINLYNKSKDLRLVQVALGHRNISNTMVYADYLYSKDELRKALVA